MRFSLSKNLKPKNSEPALVYSALAQAALAVAILLSLALIGTEAARTAIVALSLLACLLLANAGLVVPLPGELVVAAYYHWVGRYYDSTGQASRQSFGNYGVINLRAQKVLSRTAGYTALATADLNNLTDRQYRMPFDFRDPGISGFAGVEVRY